MILQSDILGRWRGEGSRSATVPYSIGHLGRTRMGIVGRTRIAHLNLSYLINALAG